MDIESVRKLFPITNVKIHTNNGEKDLVYFDHGASTHAPQPVIDKYMYVLQSAYANVHRGMHELSIKATDMFEEVHTIIADFLGVKDPESSGMHSILTYNTTSSLDLASHIFEERPGDVLTTVLEHHSNDLPFRNRGNVHHIQALDDGTLDMESASELMNQENIKLIAVTAASNVTGYMPPIEELAKLAHDHDAKILVDAAQRLAHYPLDMKPLGHPEHIDFLAAAGHKFYSPFSSAFLLGNTDELDNAAPYIPGGGTVSYVTQTEVIFVKGPDRHQYGTPNIAGAIAMGESLNFLKDIGISHIAEHERKLLDKLLKGLDEIDGVQILGDIPSSKRIGVVTFNAKNIHHETVSKELNDREGIATRNGCFCAHPYVLRLMGVPKEKVMAMRDEILKGNDPDKPGAVRAAIGIYNNKAEIDKLLNTVEAIIKDQS